MRQSEIQHISDIAAGWANRTPDALLVREGSSLLTYGQLWNGVEAACRVLDEHEVSEHDRVMVVCENSATVIALLLAITERGAIAVLVNARLSEREVDAIAKHCEPRMLLFTHHISPDAARHAKRHDATERVIAGLDSVLAAVSLRRDDVQSDSRLNGVAALIYTSGTTGSPKGVMVTHRGLIHFAKVSASSRALARTDCAYAVLPFSHIFGLATVLLATMQAGASLDIQARFDAAAAIDAVNAGRISILQGVPTMFTRILAVLRESGTSISSRSLRYIYTGGSPLDPTLKRDVESAFGLPLHHGYGMTEYAGSLCVTRSDAPRSDCAAGHAVEGAELRVVDALGHAFAPGNAGEIWVRGPGLMAGYYRAHELTREVMRGGGWFNSGDLGRIDDDGALTIVGRTKDLIIRSGFNVYPVEVESVINSYPAVRLSAVVGRTVADANEEVVAFVEIKPGMPFSVEQLHVYLAERLSAYKRPSDIICIESIPTTNSGKLLKQGLRAWLSGSGATSS